MSDADERIKSALRRIGSEHKPPPNWEARVLAAVTKVRNQGDEGATLAAERAQKLLTTAMLLCDGDSIATHDALIQSVILHAALVSDNHEMVDQYLFSAVHALVAAVTTDEERTQG